jgi:hypothetical protein
MLGDLQKLKTQQNLWLYRVILTWRSGDVNRVSRDILGRVRRFLLAVRVVTLLH